MLARFVAWISGNQQADSKPNSEDAQKLVSSGSTNQLNALMKDGGSSTASSSAVALDPAAAPKAESFVAKESYQDALEAKIAELKRFSNRIEAHHEGWEQIKQDVLVQEPVMHWDAVNFDAPKNDVWQRIAHQIKAVFETADVNLDHILKADTQHIDRLNEALVQDFNGLKDSAGLSAEERKAKTLKVLDEGSHLLKELKQLVDEVLTLIERCKTGEKALEDSCKKLLELAKFAFDMVVRIPIPMGSIDVNTAELYCGYLGQTLSSGLEKADQTIVDSLGVVEAAEVAQISLVRASQHNVFGHSLATPNSTPSPTPSPTPAASPASAHP